ncbi:hypothetical protein U0070_003074 [Myodes glareolus]|uniref:Large ribosomal subunit protein uL2 n=1 Tax=Myodes glareolus TaxID=447135 RepID=A0AAW0HT08_MYOGA
MAESSSPSSPKSMAPRACELWISLSSTAILRVKYIKGIVNYIIHDPGRVTPLAKLFFPDPYQFKKQTQVFITAESTLSSLCNKSEDRDKLALASGNYATVISHNPETKKKAVLGVVAGGSRIDKSNLKAGHTYHKYKTNRNCWPRGVAMNPVEHSFGSGNHQHIVGLIAACPTGQPCGTRTEQEKENKNSGANKNSGERLTGRAMIITMDKTGLAAGIIGQQLTPMAQARHFSAHNVSFPAAFASTGPCESVLPQKPACVPSSHLRTLVPLSFQAKLGQEIGTLPIPQIHSCSCSTGGEPGPPLQERNQLRCHCFLPAGGRDVYIPLKDMPRSFLATWRGSGWMNHAYGSMEEVPKS